MVFIYHGEWGNVNVGASLKVKMQCVFCFIVIGYEIWYNGEIGYFRNLSLTKASQAKLFERAQGIT